MTKGREIKAKLWESTTEEVLKGRIDEANAWSVECQEYIHENISVVAFNLFNNPPHVPRGAVYAKNNIQYKAIGIAFNLEDRIEVLRDQIQKHGG